MVLGELAPDPLLLRQDGKMLAGLGGGLDVAGVAQPEQDLAPALGRQVGPLGLLLLVRLRDRDARGDLEYPVQGGLVLLPEDDRAEGPAAPAAARAEGPHPLYQPAQSPRLLLR